MTYETDRIIREQVARIMERDEAHVRAELKRLGISEAEAPGRVVIVKPSLAALASYGANPPLPEVLTREEFHTFRQIGQTQRAVTALKGRRTAFGHRVKAHQRGGHRVRGDAIRSRHEQPGPDGSNLLHPRTFTTRHGLYTIDNRQMDGARRDQFHGDARYAIALIAG